MRAGHFDRYNLHFPERRRRRRRRVEMLSVLRSIRVGLPRHLPNQRSLSTTPDHMGKVMRTVSALTTGTDNALDDVIAAPKEEPEIIEVPVAYTPQFMTLPPAEDPLLHLFTSYIMLHGEREKASKTTSRVLLYLHAYTRQPPLEIFRQALHMAAPAVRCMNQRRGAKAIVKPVPLSEKQRMRKAIEWIWEVVNVRSKSATIGKTLAERTAREMIKILNGDSSVLKKKEEIHKVAMANRGAARGR
ncbi:ribosomal protein S7 domain-containing protein [Cristinia sonorae]|uniref:Ribosomal protein S7 domain-containing protein n=1 Tax=Cristinia sonorae TaxID=1940300 RepID=A0A8K0UR77_9AGAR|nr:ribosomal protein S7 domain-containing protein [Cristinia sonorae]